MKKTFYTLKSEKIKKTIKIAHLSDLHSESHGRDNCRLIEAVRAEKPDIIAMSGDMFSRTDNGYASTLSLVSALSSFRPVYYSFGNHEFAYPSRHSDNITLAEISADLRGAGAVMLDLDFADSEINGNPVRVGGLYGYMIPGREAFEKIKKGGHLRHATWDDIDRGGEASLFAGRFQDTDRFTVLLSHHFEGLLLWNTAPAYPNIDLVLSGHVHGGQVVLPLIGPMYGHAEGLFPKYARGKFENDGTTVIISAGLGNHFVIPRFNNPRELVFVTVLPEKE